MSWQLLPVDNLTCAGTMSCTGEATPSAARWV